jgi:hypothetical protein
MANTNKSQRFHILTIATLGSPNICDFIREKTAGLSDLIELASYMIKKPVSQTGLRYVWGFVSAEIRAQFPEINFTSIEEQARPLLSGGNWDICSREYQNFIHSLENNFGPTRVIKPLHESTNISKYQCSVCEAFGVKLWRPHKDNMLRAPLICAECAEKRQIPRTYHVVKKWEVGTSPNDDPCWFGIYEYVQNADGEIVVKKAPMPKWVVDDNGQIPSANAPGPDGNWPMTDQLSINMSDISKTYSNESTGIAPAVPGKNGYMREYASIPTDRRNWWTQLPTHKTKT